jgi:hypothetical protein
MPSLRSPAGDSHEAGNVFQNESGPGSRFQSGQDSDLMPVTFSSGMAFISHAGKISENNRSRKKNDALMALDWTAGQLPRYA